MQFRLSLLYLGSLTILASANPVPQQNGHCDIGSLVCCNTVSQKNSPPLPALFNLLGIPIGSVADLVGITCTPISSIGIGGGANCAQQPVCCTGNWFNGLIYDGCSFVNLSI